MRRVDTVDRLRCRAISPDEVESEPPAMTHEASSVSISRAAWATHSRPERHWHITVVPLMCLGKPASRISSRAMFGADDFTTTLPKTTSSITSGSRAGSSWPSKPFTDATARPIASRCMSFPKDLTNGVRAPATTTARRLPPAGLSLAASAAVVAAGCMWQREHDQVRDAVQ